MIFRLLLIFVLLAHPGAMLGAGACGRTDRSVSKSAEHSCCCGGACPASQESPGVCGCGNTSEPTPQPVSPTTSQVRLDIAVTSFVECVIPEVRMEPHAAAPLVARTSTSRIALHALYCVWLT